MIEEEVRQFDYLYNAMGARQSGANLQLFVHFTKSAFSGAKGSLASHSSSLHFPKTFRSSTNIMSCIVHFFKSCAK